MASQKIHFVTGRLAEHALRNVLGSIDDQNTTCTVDVLPITVAALMSPEWIAKRIAVPTGTDRIILPGYCHGDLAPIIAKSDGANVEVGPKDVRDLPRYLSGKERELGLSPNADYSIQIIAEINHAPRLTLNEIKHSAQQQAADGADIIDVGCDPGDAWTGVADCVKALKDLGLRVSIDSLNPKEIAAATSAGAQLVLSVNSSNRDAAPDWGAEVVVIPDDPKTLAGFDDTIEQLAVAGVPMRLDPILEPIAFGFAESLGRYLSTRKRYPDADMMMGIGNLTELTDVDSAGINVLLLGFCQELGIHSVLTTQVINWARTSVKECDIARRMLYHAVDQRVPPKNLEDRLVKLRDGRLSKFDASYFQSLSEQLKDSNYRIFAQDNLIHLVAAGLNLADPDPFALFQKLQDTNPANVDPAHAFYLGFEMCKAMTANQLHKQYNQDEALNWGYLTVQEKHHRVKLSGRKRDSKSDEGNPDA